MLQDRPPHVPPLLQPSLPLPDDAALLLQAAAVPLVQVDAAGLVRWANDAAVQAVGAHSSLAFNACWTDPVAAAALYADAPCQVELQAALAAIPANAWFQANSRPLPGGGWALTLLPLATQRAVQAVPGAVSQQTELPHPARGIGRPDPVADVRDPQAAVTIASAVESQLALAVELGRIALWRHDLDTDRLHGNRHAWLALGLEPRAQGLPLAEVRSLIHPEDLPRMLASARVALEGGQAADVEARVRHADGSWRTQLLRRTVLRNAAGQAVAFLGVGLDVTERQAHRHRADEIGRRFETVTRAAGIGHWIHEPGQQCPFWSDQLRALYGLEPQAAPPTMQQWLDRFVHADDAQHIKDNTRRWLKSGQDSLELSFRARRADGEVREIFSHSQLEAGSNGPLFFGVVIDLTERRRSELALKSAQERVALAARAAGLGTWEQDLASGAVLWDEQMWRLRGHTPLPVAMSPQERLACVHPEDRSRAERLTREALTSGRVVEHEFRVLWPDGSLHWLASRSMEIDEADTDGGNRRRRIGVNWDVSDIRTAATVRQEREIALRESASKSKFLARMSHELRTPLNAVLGFTQLLLADEAAAGAAAGPSSDPANLARQRHLEHIRAAGQHLLTLINDVLNLSALEGGEVPITLAPVALQALVAQTLPMVAPLQAQQQVRVEQGALDLCVLADATRLRQVLLNLLSNALKYNRPGGSVRIEALQRGPSVLLRVTDTGRGMSDEQLRHLFEPFNRLGADGGEIEGSGIGLAIVKALVERMGGSVHVDSRLGVGSVFELRLVAAVAPPSAAAGAGAALDSHAPQAAHADESAPASAAGPHRVLYIEDNPVNALIISELLARRTDLSLHVATDGASGVRQAQQLLPDLILLDMQLPDFDGFEVLRQLRAEPRTAGIRCIALSANAMPADVERALQAGLSDYWTKPLDFKAFMAALDAIFGKPR